MLTPVPRAVLPPALSAASAELAPYLADSFGNGTRIDYGTGHEARALSRSPPRPTPPARPPNPRSLPHPPPPLPHPMPRRAKACFALLLLCLARLGVLQPRDRPAAVLRCFAAYLALTRRLQRTYHLEPAGSHGAWGLDDYAFLPFLFGASQLDGAGPDAPRPSAVHDDAALAAGADEWLYLSAAAFVRAVKRGPLRETSPVLSDVAAVPGGWGRVAKGMRRMWAAEVLDKGPIAQHFLFGSLIPWPEEGAQKGQAGAGGGGGAGAEGGGDAEAAAAT